jgi:hypothetical protein
MDKFMDKFMEKAEEKKEIDDLLENVDSSWLQEFENLDKEYKDYYTEELETIKVHCIYINKNNEIERVIEDKIRTNLFKNFS